MDNAPLILVLGSLGFVFNLRTSVLHVRILPSLDAQKSLRKRAKR